MSRAVPATLITRLVAVVAAEFGMAPAVLLHVEPRTGRWAVLARQVCAYVLSVEAGHGAMAAARALNTSKQVVRHAVAGIEELRDAPLFELLIARILTPLRQEGLLP